MLVNIFLIHTCAHGLKYTLERPLHLHVFTCTSFTRMYVDDSFAGFAFDVTTPMKFTLASLDHSLLIRVVAAPAAHEQTAVHPR